MTGNSADGYTCAFPVALKGADRYNIGCWSDGRVAEGSGLENRSGGLPVTGGSNPSRSARYGEVPEWLIGAAC